MRWRGQLKYWHGCLTGHTHYFGVKMHVPKGSYIFKGLCSQGTFEPHVTEMLKRLVQPGTWLFDVGANMGMMSVPVLAMMPTVSVASFEPSPNTLPSLEKTVADSPYTDRWKLIPKAVGSSMGPTEFNVSASEYGAWDGRRDTGRVESVRKIQVEQTTLDEEWKALGKPAVSAIKCDVEGGEMDVLEGSRELLRACRPALLVEWHEPNFSAYGRRTEELLQFAKAAGYAVYAAPGCIPVMNVQHLRVMMATMEDFVLLPDSAKGS